MAGTGPNAGIALCLLEAGARPMVLVVHISDTGPADLLIESLWMLRKSRWSKT